MKVHKFSVDGYTTLTFSFGPLLAMIGYEAGVYALSLAAEYDHGERKGQAALRLGPCYLSLIYDFAPKEA